MTEGQGQGSIHMATTLTDMAVEKLKPDNCPRCEATGKIKIDGKKQDCS
jgi:hypothetical protein